MGKVRDFFDDGAGAMLIIPLCIALGITCGVIDCSKKGERDKEWARMTHEADSIKQARQVEAERLKAERKENRSRFFELFSKHYSFFQSEDEFDEWLYFANYSAIELLHYMYSMYYNDFDMEDGADKFAEYLFWSSPVYYKHCDMCDYEVEFTEYE